MASKGDGTWRVIQETKTKRAMPTAQLDATRRGDQRTATYRHRQRAGARIGDNKTVDLLRYCAWMHVVRHTPRTTNGVDPYDAMKERARARNAALALAGRDIGELPEVDNPDRKDRASRDFRYFCETYFPLTFHLAWSPDHIKVINKIEQAVVHGGLFALAMARGSGKARLLKSHVFGQCSMVIATSYV